MNPLLISNRRRTVDLILCLYVMNNQLLISLLLLNPEQRLRTSDLFMMWFPSFFPAYLHCRQNQDIPLPPVVTPTFRVSLVLMFSLYMSAYFMGTRAPAPPRCDNFPRESRITQPGHFRVNTDSLDFSIVISTTYGEWLPGLRTIYMSQTKVRGV